jgi:GntR family transcriptional regulator
LIEINAQNRIPIYKQIYSQIETLALNHVLPPNYQLTPVRQLAKTMGINPNTIVKAYTELEQNGIVYSMPGKGSFISPDLTSAQEQKKSAVLHDLGNAAKIARDFGVTRQSAIDAICQVYDTKNEVTR